MQIEKNHYIDTDDYNDDGNDDNNDDDNDDDNDDVVTSADEFSKLLEN